MPFTAAHIEGTPWSSSGQPPPQHLRVTESSMCEEGFEGGGGVRLSRLLADALVLIERSSKLLHNCRLLSFCFWMKVGACSSVVEQ